MAQPANRKWLQGRQTPAWSVRRKPIKCPPLAEASLCSSTTKMQNVPLSPQQAAQQAAQQASQEAGFKTKMKPA